MSSSRDKAVGLPADPNSLDQLQAKIVGLFTVLDRLIADPEQQLNFALELDRQLTLALRGAELPSGYTATIVDLNSGNYVICLFLDTQDGNEEYVQGFYVAYDYNKKIYMPYLAGNLYGYKASIIEP